MASPEVIKAIKDFDGLGNIALLPLFASDFICPNAVVLSDNLDVEPWLQIKKKNRIRSRASQARIDELIHELAISLRRKFRDVLDVSSFLPGSEPSASEVDALVYLWDTESLSRLHKLWEASYSLAALKLIASFFDRSGGPAPSAADLAARSKRELCEYIVSMGMMYMSPDYADGLVTELLERRSSNSLANSQDQQLAVDGSRIELVSSSDTNFMRYQLAFVKSVLFPDDIAFEQAFSRSFAPPAQSSSSSSSTSSPEAGAASVTSSPAGFTWQTFRAGLVAAPQSKRPRINCTAVNAESAEPRGSPILPSIDIRGSALRGVAPVSSSSTSFRLSGLDEANAPESSFRAPSVHRSCAPVVSTVFSLSYSLLSHRVRAVRALSLRLGCLGSWLKW